MTAPLLTIADLKVAYGAIEAVRGVSLAVPAGAIVTVIGANGAGKSSLLNATMGVIPATGMAMLDGAGLRGLAVEARVARGMALVPERRELFATMSVEDNLRLGAYRAAARALAEPTLASVFARFPRLAERRSQLAGTLSGGERQMLATGRALMSDPKLLMLDEPSLGLAPAVVETMYTTLERLRTEGLTLLLAEQAVELALEVSDYAYVLQTGRTVLQGKAADLADDRDVQRIYLGMDAAPT